MDAELKRAYRYCQSIARKEAGNFYWAFRFLSRRKRWALSAVYAFCRIADDLVDHAQDSEQARRDLRLMLDNYDAALSGSRNGALYIALADACRKFAIPRQLFEDLIRGVEMDLDGVKYQTVEEVEIYCRLVASSVGQMSIAIFGAQHPDSKHYADELGLALQWTNILRDVGEDIQRGRVYIPMDLLGEYQIQRVDVLTKSNDASWDQLFATVCRHAMDHYRNANGLLPKSDLRVLMVAEIMKSIYLATLRKIKRLRYPVFQRRVSLSTPRKVWISLTIALLRGVLRIPPSALKTNK